MAFASTLAPLFLVGAVLQIFLALRLSLERLALLSGSLSWRLN